MTVVKYLECIRGLFSAAFDKVKIAANPGAGIKPDGKVKKGKRDSWTGSEVRKILRRAQWARLDLPKQALHSLRHRFKDVLDNADISLERQRVLRGACANEVIQKYGQGAGLRKLWADVQPKPFRTRGCIEMLHRLAVTGYARRVRKVLMHPPYVTFNQVVVGSIPTGLTIEYHG